MSRFHPTQLSIHPPIPTDQLAHALVNGLGRPLGGKCSWSLPRTLAIGLVTFGVAPLFSWIRGFSAFAVSEQQQLLHLARWLKDPRLEKDADSLRPRTILSVIPILIILCALAATVFSLNRAAPPSRWTHLLLAGTYGFKKSHLLEFPIINHPRATHIFTIWVTSLSLAYLVHWLQLRIYAAGVNRFLARFNQLDVRPIKPPSLGVGIDLTWLIAAALIFALAPWGLFMMLAGCTQRRYITWTSRNTRGELSHRLRALVLRNKPDEVVSVPVYLRQRCAEKKCRAEIPNGINYCRRCGTRQKVKVDA